MAQLAGYRCREREMKLEELRELTDILEKSREDWMTIQNLSIQLGVSYKTAKKMVDQLQRELESEGIILESKRGYGIRIAPESRTQFQILNRTSEAGADEIEQPIIRTVILNSQEIRIDEICNQFYCSRKKVTQIIRRLQTELSKFQLRICSKGYHGLYLEYREENIRHYLLEKQKDLFSSQPLSAAFIALFSFILLQTDAEGVINTANFGSTGLFLAIVIAMCIAKIIEIFQKHNITIRIPESVPAMVADSFSVLISGFVVITLT